MYNIYIYYKVVGVVFVSQLIGLNFPGWYPLKQPVAAVLSTSFGLSLRLGSDDLNEIKGIFLCLIGNIHFRVKRLFFFCLIILYPSILIVFSYVLDQYLLIVKKRSIDYHHICHIYHPWLSMIIILGIITFEASEDRAELLLWRWGF